MEAEDQKRILGELDEFVDTAIGFDELTEFILDVAGAARERLDLTVPDALRFAMDSYRATSAERYAAYRESGPESEPIESAMPFGAVSVVDENVQVEFGPCCFCNREITGSDVDPCSVTVSTFGDRWQVWRCHAACFRERLAVREDGFFDPAHF